MSTVRRLRGTRSRVRRVALALASLPLLTGLAAGCGQEASPGQTVPALADRLATVDSAIEAGNLRRARAALEAMVDEATRADEAGEISPDDADRIRDAARAVLAQLPADAPQQTPPSSADPTESGDGTSPPPEDQKAENDDKDEDKEKEEEEGGDEGGGNGPSSENGPDDGHGN